MSANYSVFPIYEKMAEYLSEQSITFPKNQVSRNPTVLQIMSVLSELKDYDIETSEQIIGSSWQVSIDNKQNPDNDAWTVLSIVDLQSGENEVYFEGGWPELCLNITAKIANFTGPLVLICDADGEPIVVLPQSKSNMTSECTLSTHPQYHSQKS